MGIDTIPHMSLLASGSDIDFMIHGLFQYELFGHKFWITTTHISILIVMAILMIFACIVRKKLLEPSETPGMLQSAAELIVESLDNMVKGILGDRAFRFSNYIGSLFLFILLANLSGLLGLRPPTADFGVTLALGLMSASIIQFQNIKNNKAGAFTSLFQPLPFLFPINLIGEIAQPFSLGLRLFGNVLSGTVVMALIYALLPIFIKIGFPAFLHVYFDIFSGCIQTYVFCMLTMVFINDKQ